MNLDLAADIRPPDFMRRFSFAVPRHEKQDVAAKPPRRELRHEIDIVPVNFLYGLILMLLDGRKCFSFAAQDVQHVPDPVLRQTGVKSVLIPLLLLIAAWSLLASRRIAVEEGKERDLFSQGLQLCCNCMGYE